MNISSNEELEAQYKYNNQPIQGIIKQAKKKEDDKKKSIDPKYIFENVTIPKSKKKKKYRKPTDKKNDLDFDKIDDMVFT
tara:strand:- start:2711 stop:2950 length:240 start_codon:yes stop_codon:yes gene_type:complete